MREEKRMLRYLGMMLVIGGVVVFGVIPASAREKVLVCHAAGRAGTTHFVTLEVPANDGGFPQGHYTESGSLAAGHEDDYLGACIVNDTTTTTIDTPTTTEEFTTTSTSTPDPTPPTSTPTTTANTTTTNAPPVTTVTGTPTTTSYPTPLVTTTSTTITPTTTITSGGPPTELPRTGTDDFWLLFGVASLALVGGGGLLMVDRLRKE